MAPKRMQNAAAGLITLGVFALVLLVLRSTPEQSAAGDKPAPGQPVVLPANLGGVQIQLGLKDTAPTDWDGEITVSAGKVLSVDVVQGNPKASANGAKFIVRSVAAAKKDKKKIEDDLVRPVLRVTLDAPGNARVKVTTKQGAFDFVLDDLPVTTPKTFLEGAAAARREDGALRLTGSDTEDDYPALAKAPDGRLWLAYCAYKKSKGYVAERVLTGNFDELVPTGHGDQIKLKSFDGKEWSAAIDVTEAGLDIWRPSVAVAKGRVHISWSQQVDGNWDIYHRVYTPPAKPGEQGGWSATERLSVLPGADFGVVSTSTADGKVWLAWQARQLGHFLIQGRKLELKEDGKLAIQTWQFQENVNNLWSPAIAADSRGRVYVAYDRYKDGNYDVRVHEVTQQGPRLFDDIATSARFEARPSIVVDAKDRVWIAYEEGDEQWGKDYSTNMFRKIGFDENPGNALYIKRTLRVRCLVDGKVMEPAGDLQKALKERTANNRSVPRLAADAEGGIWLLYRHHPRPLGAGEVWNSFATRYDGKDWSSPRMLSQSENLMDNRPAVAAYGQGLLAVYSGDARPNQLKRGQNDLFASLLKGEGAVHDMSLVAAPPSGKATMKPVHPNEARDVARMRDYRMEYQGKKLHLYRGEFHRHTEYTAHRDQDGLLEDSWRYALDAGALDWMGNADHDNGHHDEYSWWQIQKMTDLMHSPPSFVAVHSYERSVKYPDGHRNVIFAKRGIRPLPRGDLKSGTEEKGTPDTKILYRYLKHFGAMCSSHTSGTGMGTDWRDNDPVVEPVVEVYQGHRHNYEHFGAPRSATDKTQIGGYEPKGFVWNAFAKGYKLGFQASSDHVSTHMSYAVVLTDDVSRQGIIDAFKRRHSYAATDNIIVEFRCGKQMMGDIFETDRRPTFDIVVKGTAPVTKVSIVRDAKYIHVAEPNHEDVKLSFTDDEAPLGKTSYYYVRVEQRDGNLAWASPMWITVLGK